MPSAVGYVVTSLGVGIGAAVLLVATGSLVARRSLLAFLPLAAAVLFFVALAHLPLPAAEMGCPVPQTEPLLQPGRLFRMPAGEVTPIYFVSTLANFGICGVIGVLLRRFSSRAAVALWSGLLLSLTIELSQLTGLFGLFPCPWRQFDVDDLILNVSGVVTGFLFAGRWWRRT